MYPYIVIVNEFAHTVNAEKTKHAMCILLYQYYQYRQRNRGVEIYPGEIS